MKIVAVMSQKGGAGKTTVAINLGVAAHLDGKRTVIIDLDPQASAASWGDSRKEDSPTVIPSFATRLQHVLATAKENEVDLVLLDTAPHAQREAQIAAEAADMILIPCRPNIFDLRAIEDTIRFAKHANKPAHIVLNATQTVGTQADDAEEAVKGVYDRVEVLPVRLGNRMAYVHASTTGQGVQEYEPRGKAAEEIQQLYVSVCGHVDM